jgi:hypothetical protein
MVRFVVKSLMEDAAPLVLNGRDKDTDGGEEV